jgi:hypothetical protein
MSGSGFTVVNKVHRETGGGPLQHCKGEDSFLHLINEDREDEKAK